MGRLEAMCAEWPKAGRGSGLGVRAQRGKPAGKPRARDRRFLTTCVAVVNPFLPRRSQTLFGYCWRVLERRSRSKYRHARRSVRQVQNRPDTRKAGTIMKWQKRSWTLVGSPSTPQLLTIHTAKSGACQEKLTNPHPL